MKSWRPSRPHKPRFEDENQPYPATRFFDQLAYIGDQNVGCFLLETNEGPVLIDCMWPSDENRDLIIQGMKDLGYDPAELRAIVITHGHTDHYGQFDYFRKLSGCTVYMNECDYDHARNEIPPQSAYNHYGALEWEISDFLVDRGVLEFGNQKIYTFLTPGHSDGGMSFVFPVTDEGREHWVALWGGTGVPHPRHMASVKGEDQPWKNTEEYLEAIGAWQKVQYVRSSIYFEHVVEEFGCDVEISAHPFVDMLCDRLDIVRNITDGVANPFVIGNDAVRASIRQFGTMCLNSMEKDAENKLRALEDAYKAV